MRNSTNVIKYTRLAVFYDRLFGNRWIAAARQRAYSLLPELAPGARLLLDGVGTGADLPFIPMSARPIGVDLVEPMLLRARTDRNAEARLVLMQAEKLGFADQAFDVVVLSLLLSVVEDGAAAFDEAVRVARPGGYLLVFDKFAPAGRKPSWTRRLLNVVTSAVGTDITRHLADLIEGQPVDILRQDCSLLGGFYQATLFRRRGSTGAWYTSPRSDGVRAGPGTRGTLVANTAGATRNPTSTTTAALMHIAVSVFRHGSPCTRSAPASAISIAPVVSAIVAAEDRSDRSPARMNRAPRAAPTTTVTAPMTSAIGTTVRLRRRASHAPPKLTAVTASIAPNCRWSMPEAARTTTIAAPVTNQAGPMRGTPP